MSLAYTLIFPGYNAGSFHWDDSRGKEGDVTALVVIGNGRGAGSYRSVSGTTDVTEYTRAPGVDTRLRLKFCGTLKDSLGRTITVGGGRFVMGD